MLSINRLENIKQKQLILLGDEPTDIPQYQRIVLRSKPSTLLIPNRSIERKTAQIDSIIKDGKMG